MKSSLCVQTCSMTGEKEGYAAGSALSTSERFRATLASAAGGIEGPPGRRH